MVLDTEKGFSNLSNYGRNDRCFPDFVQGKFVFQTGVPRFWSLRQSRAIEYSVIHFARPCRRLHDRGTRFYDLKEWNCPVLSFVLRMLFSLTNIGVPEKR